MPHRGRENRIQIMPHVNPTNESPWHGTLSSHKWIPFPSLYLGLPTFNSYKTNQKKKKGSILEAYKSSLPVILLFIHLWKQISFIFGMKEKQNLQQKDTSQMLQTPQYATSDRIFHPRSHGKSLQFEVHRSGGSNYIGLPKISWRRWYIHIYI